MILIPLDRPIDWRNPPLITLFLVLLNCACFFIWQHNDRENYHNAMQYYFESGLHRVEMTFYYRYLHPGNDQLSAPAEFVNDRDAFYDMHEDGVFYQKLINDEIIKPTDPEYSKWKPHHNQYSNMMDQVVSQRYAINPAQPSLVTMFTSMFLHGGLGHLFGNMVMLMMIGYVVEIILGHGIYLAGYFLAGLAGNAVFVLLMRNHYTTGVGASGAIFGVVGMYLILFWLRKIRFFFFFIYFNYFKAPAIIMIVPMVAWQLYMQFFMETNINVMAHLGGLSGGALVALLAKRFLSQHSRDYLDENIKTEQYQQAFAKGQQQLAAMNIPAARQIFEKLRVDYPNDMPVKLQLFNLLKFSPEDPEFHRLALQLLAIPGADRSTVKIVHDIFIDYSSKAKPRPQLNPDILLNLVIRFAANDYLADAEKIMTYLMHAKRDLARNAEGLSALCKYYSGKDKTKAAHFRTLLMQAYPNSVQAQHLSRASS